MWLNNFTPKHWVSIAVCDSSRRENKGVTNKRSVADLSWLVKFRN